MYLICFLALILVAVVSGQSGTIPEKFLKPLRPDPSGGGPLRVGVAWHISRIHHICLNDMFLEVSLRTTFSWQDKSVIDSGAPDGIIPLHMSYLQTSWKPDLFFKEIRDIQRFSMVDDLKGLWLSQKNGTFVMSFLMKISLDCPMKFTLFPFDVQTCWMTMVSYEYNENELSLEWMSQGVTVMKHLQKQIPSYYLSVRPGNSTIDFTCQNCTDEPAAALISAIRLERRYVSYLITTYFPSIFLMGIAWASLFWTPDPTPGRTSLIITTLLTTVVLYGIVRHLSPITDYSKGTDVWFFFCICFNVTIIAEFATVICRLIQRQIPAQCQLQRSMRLFAYKHCSGRKKNWKPYQNGVDQPFFYFTDKPIHMSSYRVSWKETSYFTSRRLTSKRGEIGSVFQAASPSSFPNLQLGLLVLLSSQICENFLGRL
ncbi:hypothetical protein SK128_022910 [Halocaridina rubra]|uniref:Uncharacterized protein n=1 Tax=Halocaridina rubra TaxID=373956 RepID=A0AAN8X0V5_HALRR